MDYPSRTRLKFLAPLEVQALEPQERACLLELSAAHHAAFH